MGRIIAVAIGVAWMAAAPRALAVEGEGIDVEGVTADGALSPTRAALSVGAFLPFTQAASVETRRAYALGFGGYDSARGTGTFEAATEVRLWGPVALRGGAVFTNSDRSLRPSFGARVQILRQRRHGVDGALGVFYRPEGLTEPEGEIESALSLGRWAGGTYVLGNLLYGQDPEGNERDGEVRLAALRSLASRLFAGIDGRLRFDLGSRPATLAAHHEPTFDASVGPIAQAIVGPLALSIQGGGSTLRLAGQTTYGLFVMSGVGAAF